MCITLIQHIDLHLLIANLAVFQKGVFGFGIRVINKLTSTIKDLSNDVKQFKLTLKDFFLLTPFIVWRSILEIN